jgi:hypothetical protein
MTRTRFYILLTLFCALAGVAGTAALGGNAQHEPGGLSTSEQARAALAPRFAAFRRDPTPNDAVPNSVKEGPLGSGDFADFDSARRVGNGQAWITPAQNRPTPAVCIVARGFMACPSTAELLDQGVSITVGGRHGEPDHLFGVAVDGIPQVRLEFNDGRNVDIPVESNYFSYDGQLPDRLTWNASNGQGSMDVPHPLPPPAG